MNPDIEKRLTSDRKEIPFIVEKYKIYMKAKQRNNPKETTIPLRYVLSQPAVRGKIPRRSS
jgi:hypothetical protein